MVLKVFRYLKLFYDLVRFEHTLFALPFAYIGAVLGAGGHLSIYQIIWIAAAMAGARTAGMALNRLVDQEIDAKNPRTASRPLPRGVISRGKVWGLVILSIAVLLYAAYSLNSLCLILSPVAVALLFMYSYFKRFTWFSHIVLGMILGCAPIGGWIAVTGRLDMAPIALGAAVTLWTAGFDILYACQDVAFDVKEGLYSIPATFGIKASLAISALFHLFTVLLLLGVGLYLKLGWLFYTGLAVTSVLLIYEHSIISPKDLTRLNEAFFNVNSWISVSLFVFTVLNYAV